MKILIAILSICSWTALSAQLITNNGQTPQQLVQNVLLGQGVTVSNIQFTGTPIAIGEFDGQNTNIGLKSGVVITTGTVQNNGNGPHGPNDIPNAGFDNNAAGSPLLNAQLGGQAQTFNAATLEFDFVPYSDSIKFNYVFASEEYQEYVGSDYNDAFGFFISGPGINGLQNIALVPGTNNIVAINNINNGPNGNGQCNSCQYYVDNEGVSTNDPTKVQYDGFTTVLQAKSKVECGQTYHLIITIADVLDPIFDSGIFLEANSLSSDTPIKATYALSQQAFAQPNVMAEGCVSATVTLEREGNVSAPMTIPVNTSGTAIEGTDYSNIPNTVTFPAGQNQIQFTFNALTDGLVENEESVIIEFQLTDPCGNPGNIVLNLAIADVQPVAVDLRDTTILCPGDEIELIPTPSGGVGPYTYAWNTTETSASIFVSPMTTTSYQVTVTDNCLNESATDGNTVTVPVYDPISLTWADDITEICPYLIDTIWVAAEGGAGNYTYTWFVDDSIQMGTEDTLIIQPSKTSTYKVYVEDQCGTVDSAFVEYTILSPPLELTMSEDVEICPYEEVQMSVSATGGFGDYYYYWPKTGDTLPNITVNPSGTGYYTVHVSDDCQTFEVLDSIFVKVVKPIADFRISSRTVMEKIPITFENLTQNGAYYQWDFGDGQTSTLTNPNNTFFNSGFYIVTLIAEDEKGCVDTVAKQIEILEEVYLYIPNAFTPDGDDYNGTFKISSIGILELELNIYNRWGELVFYTDALRFEWDGRNERGEALKPDVYVYTMTYLTQNGEQLSRTGHITLLR